MNGQVKCSRMQKLNMERREDEELLWQDKPLRRTHQKQIEEVADIEKS